MTVLDTVDGRHNKPMAKRQKTDHDDLQQEGQSDPDMPSDEMKAALLYNTRMPDMNIVEPTDTISGLEEITPEPEPLSESDLPPRPEGKKKVSTKKSSNGKKTDHQESQKTQGQSKQTQHLAKQDISKHDT